MRHWVTVTGMAMSQWVQVINKRENVLLNINNIDYLLQPGGASPTHGHN